jgi:hypothetical protein
MALIFMKRMAVTSRLFAFYYCPKQFFSLWGTYRCTCYVLWCRIKKYLHFFWHNLVQSTVKTSLYFSKRIINNIFNNSGIILFINAFTNNNNNNYIYYNSCFGKSFKLLSQLQLQLQCLLLLDGTLLQVVLPIQPSIWYTALHQRISGRLSSFIRVHTGKLC